MTGEQFYSVIYGRSSVWRGMATSEMDAVAKAVEAVGEPPEGKGIKVISSIRRER